MISKIHPALLAMVVAACVRVPDAQHESARSKMTDVSLDASRSGQKVSLTLTNSSQSTVGYNLCASQLMRRTGGAWTVVPTQQVCTMEIRGLPPGESAQFRHSLPPGVQAGEYQYRTSIEMAGGRTELASHSFFYP